MEVSNYMGKADTKSVHRKNKTICLPFSQEVYSANINNASDFRKCIDERIELFPELFPAEITNLDSHVSFLS